MTSPPIHPLDQQWYVRGDDKAYGPYTGLQVKEMVDDGRVVGNTGLTPVGASEWREAADVPYFASLLRDKCPPVLSPPHVAHVHIDQAFHSAAFGQLAIDNSGMPVRFAGFWIRVAAYLIDMVFYIIATVVLALLAGALITAIAIANHSMVASATYERLGDVSSWITGFAYFTVFYSSSWQATPGKRLLGLRLVRTDGQQVGLVLAIGRYFASVLSVLTLGIGLMMAGWTEQKKTLHDMICGTRVIYGRAR